MALVDCSVCNGTGEYVNQFGDVTYCSGCGGTGQVSDKSQPPPKKK